MTYYSCNIEQNIWQAKQENNAMHRIEKGYLSTMVGHGDSRDVNRTYKEKGHLSFFQFGWSRRSKYHNNKPGNLLS